MKPLMTLATVFACLAAVIPLVAAEGLLIVQTSSIGGRTLTIQLQIEPDLMRAEMLNPAGDTQAAVFDARKQVLSLINYDKKTYAEMTTADVERIGAEMSALFAQAEEQIASMPPAERAQAQAAMKGSLGGFVAGLPRPEYRHTGTDKAGKWTCDKYDGFMNNEQVSEVCTVAPEALGATAADFEIAKQLQAFGQKLMPQGFEGLLAPGDARGYTGIPVRQISYYAGQPILTNELTEVRRQNFDAATYQVPADFEKQPLPGGLGGPP